MKRGLITFLLFIISWESLGYFNVIDVLYYPAPHTIIFNTINLFNHDNLASQLAHSMFRLLTSFVITFPIAIFLSLICSHFKTFDDFFNPIVAFSFPIPKVAIYPLLLLIVGVDYWSQIFLISIGIFYLMFVNFRIGFKGLLTSQYNDVALVYNITGFNYLWNFLIRGTAREIYTGLKLAINYGLTLVVVSELTFSRNGIGYFIWRSWDQFKIVNVYSGVLVISVVGLTFYYFFNFLINSSNSRS